MIKNYNIKVLKGVKKKLSFEFLQEKKAMPFEELYCQFCTCWNVGMGKL